MWVTGGLCLGGGLSPEGLCPEEVSLSRRGSLFRGGSLSGGGLCLEGVSVWRDLCPEFVLCLDSGVPLDRDPSPTFEQND